MSIANNLLSFLKRKETAEKQEVPEGFCPGCWGRQEYGGKFYEAVKNHNIEFNSKNPDKGWIQDYADKHLFGIELKHDDDMYVCKKCKVTYRPT